MAYDRNKIYKQAIKAIEEEELFFIEDIIASIRCGKTTFYEYFPIGSNEMNKIKELLETNKINTKRKLRKKWFESDNAALQIALYKSIGTDEERKHLSQTHTDISSLGEKINIPVLSVDPLKDEGNNGTE